MRHLFAIILLFVILPMLGHQIVTLPDGSKFKLNTDGTWEWVETKEPEEITMDSNIVPLYNACECALEKNEIDEFTGYAGTSTKKEVIRNSEFWRVYCSAARVEDTYVLALINGGNLVGCASPNDSYVILKFTDGTTLKMPHKGNIDCGSKPTFLCEINDDMEVLLTKTVAKIRFSGTERFKDITLNDPKIIARHVRCLY